jgi:hypothetical protein
MNSLVKNVKVREQTPGKTRPNNTGIFSSLLENLLVFIRKKSVNTLNLSRFLYLNNILVLFSF